MTNNKNITSDSVGAIKCDKCGKRVTNAQGFFYGGRLVILCDECAKEIEK